MLWIRPMREGDDFGFSGNALYHVALNGDQLLGYCKYQKRIDSFFIEQVIDGGDRDLFDGLVRAVLDAATKIGIDRAEFGPAVSRMRCLEIGLPLTDKNFINSLDDFLTNCKNCQK